MKIDLRSLNKEFKDRDPSEIIQWVLKNYSKPLLTTNFRPYEIAIIYLCILENKNIDVLWCDTGYNTKEIYIYAENLIKNLKLNIHLYIPKQTREHRMALMGKVPSINDSDHKLFTEQVKLEPFRRAMAEIKPDAWITNLRRGQTNFRDSLDIFSMDDKGLIKISPFYYWSDKDLDIYMKENNLINEYNYYDPTKVDDNRECGLHLD